MKKIHILFSYLFACIILVDASMLEQDRCISFVRAKWVGNLFKSMNVPFLVNDEEKIVKGMGFSANLICYYIVPDSFKAVRLWAVNGLSLYICQKIDGSLCKITPEFIHIFDQKRFYGSVSLKMPQFKIVDSECDNHFYVTPYAMYDLVSLHRGLVKNTSSSLFCARDMPTFISIDGPFTFAIVDEESKIVNEKLIINNKNIVAHGYVTHPVPPEDWLTLDSNKSGFL